MVRSFRVLVSFQVRGNYVGAVRFFTSYKSGSVRRYLGVSINCLFSVKIST